LTIRIIPIPARWYEFLTSLPISVRFLIRDELDVFFAPYPSGVPKGGFGKDSKVKIVATVP